MHLTNFANYRWHEFKFSACSSDIGLTSQPVRGLRVTAWSTEWCIAWAFLLTQSLLLSIIYNPINLDQSNLSLPSELFHPMWYVLHQPWNWVFKVDYGSVFPHPTPNCSPTTLVFTSNSNNMINVCSLLHLCSLFDQSLMLGCWDTQEPELRQLFL